MDIIQFRSVDNETNYNRISIPVRILTLRLYYRVIFQSLFSLAFDRLKGRYNKQNTFSRLEMETATQIHSDRWYYPFLPPATVAEKARSTRGIKLLNFSSNTYATILLCVNDHP